MPSIKFLPTGQTVEVEPNTKILVAANRNRVGLRYGCASCRCGTCGIRVSGGSMSPMKSDEQALLQRMQLPTDGSVRLACQTRVLDGEVTVDLKFQDEYSPDQGDDLDEDEDDEEDDEEPGDAEDGAAS
jgi:ferredoxin